MNAHGLLVKAWQSIEDPAKWCGNGMRRDGSNCAWYALAVSAGSGNPGARQGAEAALVAAIPSDFIPFRYTDSGAVGVIIGRYNDHPDTTHDDIRALYMRAIASVAPQPDLGFLSTVRIEPEVRAGEAA